MSKDPKELKVDPKPVAPSAPAPVFPQAKAVSATWAAWGLYLVVFISGGILMGVEIAGTRPLAPGFGTSVFVWGSVIGLFMGAMALGYFCGGILSDRWPSFTALATFLSVAGLYVFLIPYYGLQVCNSLSASIPHRMLGPLVAAGVLYFVPVFLMAMVSPYAVKLSAESLTSLGGVAGRLYALSTFGSITGTLITTFFLIPAFYVSNVLHALGVGLILVGLISLVWFKVALGKFTPQDRRSAGMLALVVLACLEAAWIFFPVKPPLPEDQRLLAYRESAYHDIAVTERMLDTNGWFRPREIEPYVGIPKRLLTPREVQRWLKFNENHESGIFPYRAQYLNAVSYSDLVHTAVLWVEQPKRMLVVGGGGGVLPVQFSTHYPSLEQVDVLELDEWVVKLAEQYFGLGRPRVTSYVGDARTNLRTMSGNYDIIMLDAYSSGGQIPFHLLTWEFLRECRGKLSPQGVLVTNIISATQNDNPPRERPADIFLCEIKTLRASEAQAFRLTSPTPEQQQPLFSQTYVFPREWMGQSRIDHTDHRNVIVVATREDKPRKKRELIEKAEVLVSGKDPVVKVDRRVFLHHVSNLYEDHPTAEELNPKTPQEIALYGPPVPLLVDDYAPVDVMYRPIMREETLVRRQ